VDIGIGRTPSWISNNYTITAFIQIKCMSDIFIALFDLSVRMMAMYVVLSQKSLCVMGLVNFVVSNHISSF